MTEILVAPHFDAILDRLDQESGWTVGDNVAPRSPTDEIVTPAVVVYGRPGGALSGSIDGLDTDAIFPFQLTAVGKTAAQCRWVLDTAHELLTATRLEVEGRFIARLRRSYLSPRAERDDDVRPPCFYMHAEYRAMTNAAEPPGS